MLLVLLFPIWSCRPGVGVLIRAHQSWSLTLGGCLFRPLGLEHSGGEALVLLVFCPIYLKSRSSYKSEGSFLELFKRRYIFIFMCIYVIAGVCNSLWSRVTHGCKNLTWVLGPQKEQYAWNFWAILLSSQRVFFFFFKLMYLMCVAALPACIDIPHVCLIPVEVTKRILFFWNWSYREL